MGGSADDVVELNKTIAVQSKLIAALDKLLVCYRIGRNPGNLLDAIGELRARLAPK